MKSKSLLLFLVAVGFGLTLFGFQASAREDCEVKINELEIAKCAESNFKEAEKTLNATYAELEKSKEHGDKLRKAQRAWVSFRDAECEHRTQDQSGSRIGFSWYYACMEEKTQLRAEELRKYLEDRKKVRPTQ